MQQVALITGGGTGIGQALAWELAQTHDFKVYIAGRRMNKLMETANRFPQNIYPVAADVAEPGGRQTIIDSLSSEIKLDILVHNAAVLYPVKSLTQITLEEWRYHQAVNVEGPLFLTQALLRQLTGGRILHLSSGAAHHPYAGWGAYCASKAALHMIYQILRLELKKHDVSIGSLRPGVVDTPMQESVRQSDRNRFPQLSRFVELKENDALLKPAYVARFIAWILLHTTDNEFSQKEWDIREKSDLARTL